MAPSVNPDKAAALEEKKFRYDFSEKGGFPQPLKFEDKYEEREYLKGRLAAAFRIFAKYGLNEGVAGHITLRVRRPHLDLPLRPSSQSMLTTAARILLSPILSG